MAEKNECPACGNKEVYFPFVGPPECPNMLCRHYNEKHHNAIKEEKSKKASGFKNNENIGFDYDTWRPSTSNNIDFDDDGDVLCATNFEHYTKLLEQDFDKVTISFFRTYNLNFAQHKRK